MEHGQYVDALRQHAIHDSIRRFDSIPNTGMIELGYGSTRIRKPRDLPGSAPQAVDNVERVLRRVMGDVILNRGGLPLGVIRSMGLHPGSP